jgi:hypothetical protein
MKNNTILLIIAWLYIALGVANASKKNSSLVNQMSSFLFYNYSEKLYIHTDRPVYAPGENMWFAAYLRDASTMLPDTLERVLYIELIDPYGNIHSKKMFLLNNGFCNTSYQLNDDIASGKYLLVGYTNWMRNMNSDSFFTKEIKVLSNEETAENPQKVNTYTTNENTTQNSSIKNTSSKIPLLKVKLYPEGGELIEGITSKVAFYAQSHNGKGTFVTAELLDNTNKRCAIARSNKQGKGYFFIKPENNKSYKAVFRNAFNDTISFSLPPIKKEGFRLGINHQYNSESILVFIDAKGDMLLNSHVMLTAVQNNKIKTALEGRLNNGSLGFQIPKNIFSTGIVQFTLFDEQNLAQCERLAFINNYDDITLSITPQQNRLKSRSKTSYQIIAKDKEGKPVEGAFSVSVTDANIILNEDYTQPGITSQLYLLSDLPGKIENTDLLFENNPKAHKNMDLLMMVNGWRKYNWDKVLKDNVLNFKYPIEQGIFVKGNLKRSSGKKSVPKGMDVSMLMIGKGSGAYRTETDENGDFYFLVNDFSDTMQVVVQTLNRLNQKADFTIDLTSNLRFEAADFGARKRINVPEFSASVDSYTNTPLKPGETRNISSEALKEKIALAEQGFFQDTTDILLNDIEVTAKKKTSTREEMTAQYGAPNTVIGQRQIEDLIRNTPWNYGLISLLYDVFPGLKISEHINPDFYNPTKNVEYEYEGDSLVVSESLENDFSDISSNKVVEFRMTKMGLRRFYIFIDGELIGITDDSGKLTNLRNNISIDALIGMDPETIKTLELILSPDESPLAKLYPEEAMEMEVTGGNEAILSIYTKTGGGIYARSYNKGIANFRLFGFEEVKEFYTPQYEGENQDDFSTDKRITLHWMPKIYTNAEGIGEVSFYNSDIASAHRIDIVGFSASGKPASYMFVHTDTTNHVTSTSDTNTLSTDYLNKSPDSQFAQSHQSIQQFIVENNNRLPVVSAHVFIKNSSQSNLTNKDGVVAFYRDSIKATDTLIISHPHFIQKEIPVKDLLQTQTVNLLPVRLDKTTAIDVDKIVNQALKSIKKTSVSNAIFQNGVYRELIKHNDKLYGLTDVALIQKKYAYNNIETPHESMPLTGRFFRTEDYAIKIKHQAINTVKDIVPVLDPLQKGLPFLFPKNKDYKYRLAGEIKYMNRNMYKIAFIPDPEAIRALPQGYFLIDKETLGFAYIAWYPSEQSKKYDIPQMYLLSAEEVKSFKNQSLHNEAVYEYIDGIWMLKYAKEDLNCLVNGVKYGFEREYFAVNKTQKPENGFKAKPLKAIQKRNLLIKNVNYLPFAWRQPWCLIANKYINEQLYNLHEVTTYQHSKK